MRPTHHHVSAFIFIIYYTNFFYDYVDYTTGPWYLFYLFTICYTNVSLQLSRLWMCEVTMTKGLRHVSVLSPWLLLKGLEMHQCLESLVCVLYLIYYYCIIPCCISMPVFMQWKFVVFLLEWHGWKWDSYINLSGILNGMARLDSSIIWIYIVYNEIQMATMLCYYHATHCYMTAAGCYRMLQATTGLYLIATS